ncbi:hypothetical protein IUS38_24320 [Mycobacteroides abscessus subsp. abscessus]|uniref:nucleotide disphospho-sugar-binding domain-containing protein n=1 Tax=Mycobacteroides abscessus TaxID=36809 RepID=UPI0019D1C648|nr:nucleotide disphospho-sugar-binding domain-containing protein [Mycobacteroides abscessus]MBN7438715.1 hypothetical protein [Mycobacteroides abscessus subsp. abscessus]
MEPALHVAIVVPPLVGHVIPSMGIARELTTLGHRVTYVAHERFRGLAESVPAALAPTTVLYDGLTSGFIANPVLGPIVNVIRAGNKEIDADLEGLVKYFTADPVDVICVGYASQIGYALSDRLAVPRATLYSTYAWNKRLQEDTYGVLKYQDELGAALQERNKLAHKFGFSTKHTVPFGPPSEVNLVPIPRFFQYYPECFDESYVFMGPDISTHPGTALWEPQYPELPLLYISLGTTYNDNIEFFRACVEQFGDGEFEVAMSVGERIQIEDLGELPDTVHVQRSFPQISVLRHASVFVSHAGMGSTMEALITEVPIVAVPQQGDQLLNAGKIHALGIGVNCASSGDMDLKTIGPAVRGVIGEGCFREQLKRRHAQIDSQHGLASGVAAIASLC